MMDCAGFDVIVALENSSYDMTFHSDSMMAFDEMDCSDSLSLSGQCDLHKGMNVESHPQSMRQVVNIIVALHRMKHFKHLSEFSQDELFSIIMENVIEERHVERAQASPRYTRSKVLQCSVCDQYQKYLVKSSEALHLQAVTLKGGNDQHKVRLNLSTYISPNTSRPDSQPVCLGISKSNLYLACTKPDQSKPPTLVLKEISDTLNTIEDNDPKGYDQLLFYRKETGVSHNTFESVKFPGWFISTAFDDYERVEVHQKSAEHINVFALNDQQLVQK